MCVIMHCLHQWILCILCNARKGPWLENKHILFYYLCAYFQKPNIWSKKNAGVTQRAAKDYEEKLEEEDVFERSK